MKRRGRTMSSFRRGKAYVGDSIGDDTIVINIESGTYYSLAKPAGDAWAVASKEFAPLPSELLEAAFALAEEGILERRGPVDHALSSSSVGSFFTKYTDMADILQADPIHDVDKDGWPTLR